MNHLQTWEDEKSWDRGHAAWSRYIKACCKAMGVTHDDGNEATDGYSLDTMYDAYRAGITADAYAKGVRVG